MKKFRMMLPVVAFLMAVGVALAGEYMPPINAYYKIGANCSTTTQSTDQSNCQTGLPTSRPFCTVNLAGHPQAYNNSACTVELRYIP
jgi:hypothetical protein